MTDYSDLWHSLAAVYDEKEAQALVRHVLDIRFGLSATDVYCGKVTQLSADDRMALDKIMKRLLKAEPVQYVLGKAFFAGREFHVGPEVLIPRPETEELCQWVEQMAPPRPAVLDIGTGSGCIAVTLAKELPGADVTAWDISGAALDVARHNAESLGATVRFDRHDALDPPHDDGRWTVVVSNPPYICRSEQAAMERNVLDYEPHTALFVPDDDPLLFYRAIANYAIKALVPGGLLFFEINPMFAEDLAAMLSDAGYGDVEVKDDFCQRQRFIKARRQ